jgi:hypothetical protein
MQAVLICCSLSLGEWGSCGSITGYLGPLSVCCWISDMLQLSVCLWVSGAAVSHTRARGVVTKHIKHYRKTGDGVRTVAAPVTRCPPTPFYGVHRAKTQTLAQAVC